MRLLLALQLLLGALGQQREGRHEARAIDISSSTASERDAAVLVAVRQLGELLAVANVSAEPSVSRGVLDSAEENAQHGEHMTRTAKTAANAQWRALRTALAQIDKAPPRGAFRGAGVVVVGGG